MRQGADPGVQMGMLWEKHMENDCIERALVLLAVTDEQLMVELKSSKWNAVCKLEEKRTLAYRFASLKALFLNDIYTVNPESIMTMGASIESISVQWKSKNYSKCKVKNKDLILCIVLMIEVAKPLTNALDQHQK